MAVKLNQHDLQFILDQIKIAEAHATGTPLTDLVDSPLLPYGLRTVDGSFNNLVPGRESWAASDQAFLQITNPEFRNESDDSISFGTPTNSVTLDNNDYASSGTPTGMGLNGGTVVDADPRLISNLIVDQTSNNPIATQIYERYQAEGRNVSATPLFEEDGVTPVLGNDGTQLISYQFDNVSPDIGDSAPYNSLFTLFGQFFDHGLDLVGKGGNGTVYIPLQPDDPLYVEGSHANFMALTRVSIGEDAKNHTTPWVDQNQTYGSHASHQVFLREYATGPDGQPVSTGHLLEGSQHGMSTWGDVKAQAENVLGIRLTDLDVANIPVLATDAYGNFIPGANGYAQLVVITPDGSGGFTTTLVEGDPADPVDPSAVGAARTGHAFLADIAHSAVPVVNAAGALVQDGDDVAGNAVMANTRGNNTEYDNELLDAHFIAGDGRANENIGLTAIHHVFHSEHNRIVEHTKDVIVAHGDLDFLNEWLLVPVSAVPTSAAAIAALSWDGARLFQAGRFTTEMEYQHLVFEEFARKMQPDVDAFVFEPDPDINPAIFAEFANVVYRFGHSMLNETVDRINADGSREDMTLFDAFLNPLGYDKNGTISHDQAAGAVIRGMSAQVGNEIDEFVTNVLRNQLVGIPLDLAAINIARGRDTGMPTLNEARAQFKAIAGGDTQLDPYTGWTDFALNLLNPESVVNFIAAYGTHALITAEDSLAGKRAAAMALVFGTSQTFIDGIDGLEKTIVPPATGDRMAFLNGTGAYAEKLGGLDDVDLWMGGLAEKKMSFGGMLGSTFSFVFELQLENLQDGDRFYYLSRVQGLNLLTELENNSLSKMALANTDLEETDTAIPADFFSRPDVILYLDHAKQMAMTGEDDPVHDNPTLEAISKMVERRDGDAPISVEASGLPAGVTFDAETGTLVGAVTVAGVYEVTFTSTYQTGPAQTRVVRIVAAEATPASASDLDILVDDAYYNATYPDVADAGVDPDTHYAQSGWNEARQPNAFFDKAFYQAQLPGMNWTGVNVLVHYAEIGWKLGLDPSADFDTDAYLAAYPDIVAAGLNPLVHYLSFGQAEGRPIFPAEPSDAILLEAGQSFTADLPQGIFAGDGVAEYLRYNGGAHVLIKGTDGNDTIIAGEGDDAIWGGAGDDRLEGGYGVDHVHGEDGDDIITNSGTDIGEMDFLHGGAGNDAIHGGSGLALIFGNEGKDFIVTGPDGKEVFGGSGDDFIRGGDGGDVLIGEEGDDWLEGGDRFDTLTGENSELFFNSTIIGHDVLNGGQGDTDYDAESGDDIMFQGVGIQRNNGMAGFDWAIHKGDSLAANSDLGIPIFVNQEEFILRDRFDLVEGLSGWEKNDVLTGRSGAPGARDEVVGGAAIPAPGDPFLSWSNALTAGGVARIDGFDKIVGHIDYDASDDENVVMETGDGSDIILGGGGSDLITGKAGNDIIDGDRWLNVRISIRNAQGQEIATADGMTGKMYASAEALADAQNSTPMFGGKNVQEAVFDRTINPGQLHIVREMVNGNKAGDVDIAVYSDVMENYTFTKNTDGSITIDHTGFNDDGGVDDGVAAGEGAPNAVSDGTDTVRNIEVVRFSDGNGGFVDVLASQLPYQATGVPVISDMTPTEGQRLTLNTSAIQDGNGLGAFSYQWQVSEDGGATWSDIQGATGSTFTPNNGILGFGGQVGDILRARVGFTDGAGYEEVIFSEQTAVVGEDWNGSFLNRTFNGTEGDDIANGHNPVFILSNGADTMNGNGGDDILDGNGGNDTINGGAGNDTINGGGNNDRIIQLSTDGRDIINGGSGTDTYQLNGVAGAETFTIYSRAAAVSAIAGLTLAAGTEIVVARDGVVIAELDNIEEIVVNTLNVTANNGGGLDQGVNSGDTIQVIGNFNGTSLNFSTITIDGNAGSDTVDISALDSAHRIVFRSNGGQDTIVGQLRSQDVIELPAGSNPADYELIENENGTKTLRSADHSVTFASDGTPEVRVADPVAEVDHSDDGIDTPVQDGDDQEVDEDEVDEDEVENEEDEAEDEDDDHIGDDDEEEDDDHIGDDDEDADDDVAAGGSPASGVPTAGADLLIGSSGDDTLLGLGGDDSILGKEGADVITGGEGNDFLSGDAGRDVIFAGAGNDDVLGGNGADMLYGDAGNDRILAGSGNDLVSGGTGSDTVFGGAGGDTFLAEVGDGNDTYYGDDLGGGTGIDTLDMSAIMANITVDLGSSGRGRVSSAETGSDTLHGVENIVTGSGDDVITASSAVNVIDGGDGDDILRFLSAKDADGDTIAGFQPGDRIDLSGIDADTGACGNQSFTIVSGGFTGAGELMISEEVREDGVYTVLRGNTDGDDEADFEIGVRGSHQITDAQFGL